MTITYFLDKPLSAEAVQALLFQTEWANNRTVSDLQTMLDRSICASAWNGAQLIGFARALSDGTYRAFIEDVIVDEAWRRQGIGKHLVQQLVDHLLPIEEIILFCEDKRIPFYEQFGFQKGTITTMHLRQA